MDIEENIDQHSRQQYTATTTSI